MRASVAFKHRPVRRCIHEDERKKKERNNIESTRRCYVYRPVFLCRPVKRVNITLILVNNRHLENQYIESKSRNGRFVRNRVTNITNINEFHRSSYYRSTDHLMGHVLASDSSNQSGNHVSDANVQR